MAVRVQLTVPQACVLRAGVHASTERVPRGMNTLPYAFLLQLTRLVLVHCQL